MILGSQEELEDLKQAYEETHGDIGEIMMQIPHSTYEDEARFITILSDLIKNKELKASPAWKNSVHDEKARLVRRKQGEKEAAEAEEMAKELGVWDEFYGSGKTGERKGKSKAENQDEEDYSALQAIILKKKKNTDSFFDDLAAKYATAPKSSKKSKRKQGQDDDEDESHTAKKSKKVTPPDIDDAEFEKSQQKLFSKKEETPKDPPKRKSRSRKTTS
jgi:DnaJ homolog subfamily C member 9